MAKSKRKKQANSPIVTVLNSVKERMLTSDKMNVAFGFLALVIWVFTLVSFISFLFTGAADLSKLDLPFGKLLVNADVSFDNWAGKIGAYISNLFINKGFGLGSFALLYFVLMVGLRFMRFVKTNLLRVFTYSVLSMIWLSLFFGFFFENSYEDSFLFLGGAHGYYIGVWLSAAIGNVGAISVIFLSLFLFYLFAVPNSLELLRSIPGLISNQRKEVENFDSNFTEDFQKDEPSYFSVKEPMEPEVQEELHVDVVEEDLEHSNSINEVINGDDSFVVEKAQDEPTIEDEPNQDEHTVETDMELEVEEKHDEEQVRRNIVERGEGDYDPKLDLTHYSHPRLDLLIDYPNNVEVTKEELEANKNRIVQTLENYSIAIDSIKATIGPTVTLYEIVPAAGVRIAKIRNLEDDIALSLSALGIRIIAPIPGKGTIGIEVPNRKPEMVSMRSVIASKKFQESHMELPVAMGKTITNETYVFDLAKMPHLLVAGATGQGKSVGLNAIITSLLYKKHPSQLKLVMVDPKKVELSIYSKMEKHFLAMMPDQEEPIINDVSRVVQTLNSLTVEMDSRYDLLKNARARNIKEYNKKFTKRQLNPMHGHKYLPYIVLVIDEFADLIMTAGKEVELPIARIAQLARAVGIHMIIATQRPSTNIITGVIKANFPARIAFKVSSMIDSRTILDSPGANQLIGRGDMLISSNSELIRLQCAFVDTPEVEAIVDYVHDQQGYPSAFELPEYVGEEAASRDAGEDPLANMDALFKEAAQILVLNQSGSTSLLQRKFSIGYNRAGRLMDQMEAAGIVGPFEGSKARKVLIHDEAALQNHFEIMGI